MSAALYPLGAGEPLWAAPVRTPGGWFQPGQTFPAHVLIDMYRQLYPLASSKLSDAERTHLEILQDERLVDWGRAYAPERTEQFLAARAGSLRHDGLRRVLLGHVDALHEALYYDSAYRPIGAEPLQDADGKPLTTFNLSPSAVGRARQLLRRHDEVVAAVLRDHPAMRPDDLGDLLHNRLAAASDTTHDRGSSLVGVSVGVDVDGPDPSGIHTLHLGVRAGADDSPVLLGRDLRGLGAPGGQVPRRVELGDDPDLGRLAVEVGSWQEWGEVGVAVRDFHLTVTSVQPWTRDRVLRARDVCAGELSGGRLYDYVLVDDTPEWGEEGSTWLFDGATAYEVTPPDPPSDRVGIDLDIEEDSIYLAGYDAGQHDQQHAEEAGLRGDEVVRETQRQQAVAIRDAQVAALLERVDELDETEVARLENLQDAHLSDWGRVYEPAAAIRFGMAGAGSPARAEMREFLCRRVDDLDTALLRDRLEQDPFDLSPAAVETGQRALRHYDQARETRHDAPYAHLSETDLTRAQRQLDSLARHVPRDDVAWVGAARASVCAEQVTRSTFPCSATTQHMPEPASPQVSNRVEMQR